MKSGTTFTAEEICSILKTCRDSGVTHFECNAFSAQLGRSAELPGPWDFPDLIEPSNPAPLRSPAKTFAEPNHQKQSEQALAHEEVRLREDQIAELTLTDPLEAERMIVDGELKDNDAGFDEDS